MKKAEFAQNTPSLVGTERLHFTAVSYNIHKCIGRDGRKAPERIARVLRELDSPIVGLQEVDSLTTDGSQTDYLARATALAPIAGPAIRRGERYYGNVLLTGYPILESRCLDITVPHWEPRSVIDAIVDINGVAVRVINTHLGLTASERRHQIQRLLDILCNSHETAIVLGDINEWIPFSPRLRALRACLGSSPDLRTFPSRLPVLALDRIWVRPQNSLRSVRVHRSRLARIASDHLPVVADIALEGGKAG